MWIWKRTLKIGWRDHITNDEVRRIINAKKLLRKIIIERKKSWIEHILRGSKLITTAIEGHLEGSKTRGRPRISMLDELIGNGSYTEMKRRAEHRNEWRKWNP